MTTEDWVATYRDGTATFTPYRGRTEDDAFADIFRRLFDVGVPIFVAEGVLSIGGIRVKVTRSEAAAVEAFLEDRQ